MQTVTYVSLRDIFRWLLKRTYEEMRELNLIEDKLTNGSPRTIKVFSKFLISNFQPKEKFDSSNAQKTRKISRT